MFTCAYVLMYTNMIHIIYVYVFAYMYIYIHVEREGGGRELVSLLKTASML